MTYEDYSKLRDGINTLCEIKSKETTLFHLIDKLGEYLSDVDFMNEYNESKYNEEHNITY